MAVTMAWMFGIDWLYHLVTGDRISLFAISYWHAFVDLSTCLAMVAIAAKANRTYTLWMAGFQIVALAAHAARAVSEAITPIAYVILYSGPSYFQTIILSLGLWFHYRRVKRHGSYRSWLTSWRPSRERLRRN